MPQRKVDIERARLRKEGIAPVPDNILRRPVQLPPVVNVKGDMPDFMADDFPSDAAYDELERIGEDIARVVS